MNAKDKAEMMALIASMVAPAAAPAPAPVKPEAKPTVGTKTTGKHHFLAIPFGEQVWVTTAQGEKFTLRASRRGGCYGISGHVAADAKTSTLVPKD